MISIVVPFTPGDVERDRNWAWVRRRYQHLHPGWEIVEHPDPGPGEWSKGRALNAAAEHASGELLVIADADVFVGADTLTRAVALVEAGAPWVVPHSAVYRLSQIETVNLTARPPTVEPRPIPDRLLERHRHHAICGGGIVVCPRHAFEQVGGIDERFVGWGGEDLSFGRALDTLAGRHAMLRSPMWHLHHRPMRRHPGKRASPENELLAGAYKDAEGDPWRMAELCRKS